MLQSETVHPNSIWTIHSQLVSISKHFQSTVLHSFCKMAAILCRSQCVRSNETQHIFSSRALASPFTSSLWFRSPLTSLEIPHRFVTCLSQVIWWGWWVQQIRYETSWWPHDMDTFFVLLTLCEGNPPVTGGFPTHLVVIGGTVSCRNDNLRCYQSRQENSDTDVWCFYLMLA